MITNKSDYDFVIFEEDFLIDGGIMPKREGLQQLILRGEDQAFLTELTGVIWTVHENSNRSKTRLDRRIRYRPLYNVIDDLKMYADLEWLIKPPPDVGTIVYDVYHQDMVDAFNLFIDESEFISDEKKFFYGAKVEQQPILDIYEDASKLIYIPDFRNYISNVDIDHTYEHDEWDDEYPIPQTASHSILMLFNVYRHKATSSEGDYIWGAWKREYFNGGKLTLPAQPTRAKYAVCNKVVVFATYGEWYYSDSGGETTHIQSNQYACGVVSASTNTSTGEITIDFGSLKSFSQSVLSHYGFNEKTSSLFGEQQMYLSLAGVYPIWELNDRMKW